jgi:DnaJ domain
MVEVKLNSLIKDEISRIANVYGIEAQSLEDFAHFVVENHKKKDPKPKVAKVVKAKPLTLTQLKKSIYEYFKVSDTKELKESETFQMATSAMGKVDLSKKDGWEKLYRKLVGVLPNEENEKGYGCINGIDIFKYDMPWKVFALDSTSSTDEDVKSAYRELSKIYHPDKPEGDAQVFDRLTTFYKSLTEKF